MRETIGLHYAEAALRMGSREGLRSRLILTGEVGNRPQLPTPHEVVLPVPDGYQAVTLPTLIWSPSPIPGVVQILACCISYLHSLVPQGMESPPREEVFLGAFQFQPENTIQMFPLQVPGEATKEHLQSVPQV